MPDFNLLRKDDTFYEVEPKGHVSIDDVVLSRDDTYKTARCTACHFLIGKDTTGYRCGNVNCPHNRRHVADLSRIAYMHEPLTP